MQGQLGFSQIRTNSNFILCKYTLCKDYCLYRCYYRDQLNDIWKFCFEIEIIPEEPNHKFGLVHSTKYNNIDTYFTYKVEVYVYLFVENM